MNGTHPHCDRPNAIALAFVDSIASSAESSRTDDGTTSVTILGYTALGLILVAGVAMLCYWIYVYRKGNSAGKKGRPAPAHIVSFPEFMVQAKGRNSLGSSVRSDIGTNMSIAISGLSTVHEEPATVPAPKSAMAPKTSVKKPVKKSVFFTPEGLNRLEQRLSDQATRYQLSCDPSEAS
ncbi:hypothetical protein Sste5346_003153 [Sporothrix stenoceras]|uniref:Transmembrane protein n=1 Tax=Sporothrix stenoceras TaxID=5173 RepID=A0ABR3ZEW4_9PEZI